MRKGPCVWYISDQVSITNAAQVIDDDNNGDSGATHHILLHFFYFYNLQEENQIKNIKEKGFLNGIWLDFVFVWTLEVVDT